MGLMLVRKDQDSVLSVERVVIVQPRIWRCFEMMKTMSHFRVGELQVLEGGFPLLLVVGEEVRHILLSILTNPY